VKLVVSPDERYDLPARTFAQAIATFGKQAFQVQATECGHSVYRDVLHGTQSGSVMEEYHHPDQWHLGCTLSKEPFKSICGLVNPGLPPSSTFRLISARYVADFFRVALHSR
jgi:hypothetical protein